MPIQLSAFRRRAILAMLLVVASCVAFVALRNRPVVQLAEATGLYAAEIGREQKAFQWTSSRATFPLHGQSHATLMKLTLAAEPWSNRRPSIITLTADDRAMGSFTVATPRRHYYVVLPGDAAALHLHASLDRPSASEWRWVGVQVFAVGATASGFPIRALATAIGVGLATALSAYLAYRLIVRGYGALALITLLGLGARIIRLREIPLGAHHDELISLVDAWYLLHTGHDHLGHVLPLGAFEAFGDWISPLLTYLNLPAVALLGPDPLAGRLTTALIGTIAIPLIYGLARAYALPKWAALTTALVVAVSPWQISLGRTAIPPALVFTILTLCLWAGLRFIERGEQREAWLLALAAGLGLYAYPTLKMITPLLVAGAVLLALHRHGWRTAYGWMPPAFVLAMLWMPFVWVTLFNSLSSNRFGDLMIQAEPGPAWLADWLHNYTLYFRPGFYYLFGDRLTDHGYLKRGVQLWAELPLVATGLGLVVWRALAPAFRREHNASPIRWQFLLAMIVLMPLPASLTWQNPHAYRATAIGPIYALLAGVGVAAIGAWIAAIRPIVWRRTVRGVAAAAFIIALLTQSGVWFADYVRDYRTISAELWLYQDGLLETLRAANDHAAEVDEIWFDRPSANIPYISLLTALPTPLDNPQQQITVVREPGKYNEVVAVGKYRFIRIDDDITYDLPAREAILNRLGQPVYLLQEWRHDGKTILLIRLYG